MKLFVIALERAHERRAKIKKQLDAAGVPFTFFDALDGRNLTEAQKSCADQEKRRKITRYPLTSNEIACCLSHRQVCEDFLKTDEKMIAIIEDDAQIFDNLKNVLEAIEACDVPFDIIDLHRTFKKKEIFLPLHKIGDDVTLGRIGYDHIKATGYVISRNGAKIFVKLMQKFSHMNDKEYHRYWSNKMNLYGLQKPALVEDDGGASFIDETRKHDAKNSRQTFPNAERSYWVLRRFLSKAIDSIQKRLYFHLFYRK